MIPNFEMGPHGYDPMYNLGSRYSSSYIGFRVPDRVLPIKNIRFDRDDDGNMVASGSPLLPDGGFNSVSNIEIDNLDFTYPTLGLFALSDESLYFIDESPASGRYLWGISLDTLKIFAISNMIEGDREPVYISDRANLMHQLFNPSFTSASDVWDAYNNKSDKCHVLSRDFGVQKHNGTYLLIYKAFIIGELTSDLNVSLCNKGKYLIDTISSLLKCEVTLDD